MNPTLWDSPSKAALQFIVIIDTRSSPWATQLAFFVLCYKTMILLQLAVITSGLTVH